MTSSSQIRTALLTMLETVPAIGRVHGYERYAKNEKDFSALYLWSPDAAASSKPVRGWHVRRVAVRRSLFVGDQVSVSTDWRLRGFLSIQDAEASELMMDALVDAVMATYDQDLTLGGLLSEPAQAGAALGPQMTESGPYMLGGVLVHGVTLSLTTNHYENRLDTSALADLETLHANWELPPRAEVGPEIPDDANAVATDHLTNLQD
tara:strand:- start:17540 stop:18160 length:621 start_codon:yes stop_codon:yes gene_type:complete